jgi:hypothetical protein
VSTATVSGNGGGKQTYTYDETGNTKEIKQDPGNKILASGATLASGQSMVSDSVRLTMQADGNLVVYSLSPARPCGPPAPPATRAPWPPPPAARPPCCVIRPRTRTAAL